MWPCKECNAGNRLALLSEGYVPSQKGNCLHVCLVLTRSNLFALKGCFKDVLPFFKFPKEKNGENPKKDNGFKKYWKKKKDNDAAIKYSN